MFSRKGRIYSFGSLTLVGLAASVVGAITQSPEAAVAAGAATSAATQSGILDALQNKGFEGTIKLLENIGAISANLGADDTREVLIKVAESLNKSGAEQNHDIAKAVRQAILSIIENAKARIEDKDDQKAIENILKTDEVKWSKIELLKQKELFAVAEDKIPLFFAVKAEDIAKIESPVKESEWKLILLEIARQNDCSLTQNSINQISSALYKKFPQSLREVFAQDFAKDGVAYSKLLLALVGDINASQAEILDEIIDVSQKQDKYQIEIREWFRTIWEEIRKPLALPALPRYITADGFPSHTNFFTGRGDVLKGIKDELKKTKRATLHGISGLGKTSVLLEFAKRAENDYEHIIFLRATKDNALNSFARLAEKVDESAKKLEKDVDKAAKFKSWLEGNNKWLLLIDNVDVPGEVKPLLPVNLRGDILSSGNSDEITILGNEVEIKKMTSKNGELLLYRRAKTLSDLTDEAIKARLEKETEAEQIAIRNIIKEFDGLPLALNLAGAYIHKFNKKFADYENLYKKSAHKLLEKQDINDHFQNDSVAKTFSLAFETISTPETDNLESKQIAETAVLFLKTASFLHSEAIPLEIFTEIFARQSESAKELCQDELFFDEVFAKIAQFDLFEKDKAQNSLETHYLVQKIIFNKIENEEKWIICIQILDILIVLVPTYNYYNNEICEKLYKHSKRVLECAYLLNIQSESVVISYYRIGEYQRLLGEYEQAEKFHKLHHEISRDFYGENHLLTARSMNCVGMVLDLQGYYEEAHKLFEKALQITEKILGQNCFEYANNLDNLAGIHQSRGEYSEAIEKLEEALKIDEILAGKEHKIYAGRLGNLGQNYFLFGNIEKALKLQETALSIFEKTVGKKHPEYAICLNDLAVIYQTQGKCNEAEEKLVEAMKIDAITFGTKHPEYATRLSNLANVYLLQGKYEQSIKLYEKALNIDEKTIGTKHPEYAIHLGNLASVYMLKGNFEEAINLYEKALWIDEITIGKTHPEYATRLSNLANVYMLQKKFDEAFDLYEEVLEIDKKVFPKNHPYIETAKKNLEKVRRKMEKM